MNSYQEKKIVVVLDKHVDNWIALNIVGHLSVAIGATLGGELMGRRELHDASGGTHSGISKYPLVILGTQRTKLSQAISAAKTIPEIFVADYPQQMLDTGHDDELAKAISMIKSEQLQYLGALFFGPSELVGQITGKFSLWK